MRISKAENSHIAFRRIVSAFISIAVLFTSSGFPAYAEGLPALAEPAPRSIDLSDLSMPLEFGNIQEIFQGRGDQTIILVQDAHAIPDAQRNIQNIIGHFQKTYGLNLVALEGAVSELDSQIFKSFPDKEVLEKVFNRLMEQGEVTGSSMAAVFNPEPSVYRGIEDWSLYETGLGLYQKAMNYEQEIQSKIDADQKSLQKKKEAVYSRELLALDAALSDFYSEHGNLVDALKRIAAIRAPEKGTELALLLEESRRAQEHPTPQEEGEVKKIAARVRSALELSRARQSDVALLNDKLQEFQTSQISAQAFAVFLEDLAAREKLSIKVSGQLSRAMRNQKRIRDLEGTRLLSDFKAYAAAVKSTLFKNDSERKLDEESRLLELFERMNRLELSREDWNELKEVPPASPYKQLLKPHVLFYENAEARDDIFFEKLTEFMAEHQAKASLFVAGGFHAESLTRKFRDHGISYALLAPKMNSVPADSRYRDHMKGDVSWKNYYQIENGKVNLYEAFVRGVREALLQESKEERGELLKKWRDRIIQDLARREKIESAREYTRFIDESAPESLRRQWMPLWQVKAEKFIEGLRELDLQGRLSEQNILSLFNASMLSDPVYAALDPGAWFHRERLPAARVSMQRESVKIGARSELRSESQENIVQLIKEVRANAGAARWKPFKSLANGFLKDALFAAEKGDMSSAERYLGNARTELAQMLERKRRRKGRVHPSAGIVYNQLGEMVRSIAETRMGSIVYLDYGGKRNWKDPAIKVIEDAFKSIVTADPQRIEDPRLRGVLELVRRLMDTGYGFYTHFSLKKNSNLAGESKNGAQGKSVPAFFSIQADAREGGQKTPQRILNIQLRKWRVLKAATGEHVTGPEIYGGDMANQNTRRKRIGGAEPVIQFNKKFLIKAILYALVDRSRAHLWTISESYPKIHSNGPSQFLTADDIEGLVEYICSAKASDENALSWGRRSRPKGIKAPPKKRRRKGGSPIIRAVENSRIQPSLSAAFKNPDSEPLWAVKPDNGTAGKANSLGRWPVLKPLDLRKQYNKIQEKLSWMMITGKVNSWNELKEALFSLSTLESWEAEDKDFQESILTGAALRAGRGITVLPERILHFHLDDIDRPFALSCEEENGGYDFSQPLKFSPQEKQYDVLAEKNGVKNKSKNSPPGWKVSQRKIDGRAVHVVQNTGGVPIFISLPLQDDKATEVLAMIKNVGEELSQYGNEFDFVVDALGWAWGAITAKTMKPARSFIQRAIARIEKTQGELQSRTAQTETDSRKDAAMTAAISSLNRALELIPSRSELRARENLKLVDETAERRIQEVFSHYDLGGVEEIQLFRPDQIQHVYHHRLLVTVTTKDGRRFVIKEQGGGSPYEEPTKLDYMYSVHEHLARNGHPVPQVHRNKEGKFYTEVEGSAYSILDYLEGVQGGWVLGLNQRIRGAKLLARMGGLLSGYTPPVGEPNQPNIYDEFENNQQRIRQLVNILAQKESRNEVEQFIVDSWPSLEYHFEKASENLNRGEYDALDKQVTHGDYAPVNMIMPKDNSPEGDILGVIDFRPVADVRSRDFMSGFESPFEGRSTQDALALFTAVYQEEAKVKGYLPLSQKEIHALPEIYRISRLRLLSWIADKGAIDRLVTANGKGDSHEFEWFQSILAALEKELGTSDAPIPWSDFESTIDKYQESYNSETGTFSQEVGRSELRAREDIIRRITRVQEIVLGWNLSELDAAVPALLELAVSCLRDGRTGDAVSALKEVLRFSKGLSFDHGGWLTQELEEVIKVMTHPYPEIGEFTYASYKGAPHWKDAGEREIKGAFRAINEVDSLSFPPRMKAILGFIRRAMLEVDGSFTHVAFDVDPDLSAEFEQQGEGDRPRPIFCSIRLGETPKGKTLFITLRDWEVLNAAEGTKAFDDKIYDAENLFGSEVESNSPAIQFSKGFLIKAIIYAFLNPFREQSWLVAEKYPQVQDGGNERRIKVRSNKENFIKLTRKDIQRLVNFILNSGFPAKNDLSLNHKRSFRRVDKKQRLAEQAKESSELREWLFQMIITGQVERNAQALHDRLSELAPKAKVRTRGADPSSFSRSLIVREAAFRAGEPIGISPGAEFYFEDGGHPFVIGKGDVMSRRGGQGFWDIVRFNRGEESYQVGIGRERVWARNVSSMNYELRRAKAGEREVTFVKNVGTEKIFVSRHISPERRKVLMLIEDAAKELASTGNKFYSALQSLISAWSIVAGDEELRSAVSPIGKALEDIEKTLQLTPSTLKAQGELKEALKVIDGLSSARSEVRAGLSPTHFAAAAFLYGFQNPGSPGDLALAARGVVASGAEPFIRELSAMVAEQRNLEHAQALEKTNVFFDAVLGIHEPVVIEYQISEEDLKRMGVYSEDTIRNLLQMAHDSVAANQNIIARIKFPVKNRGGLELREHNQKDSVRIERMGETVTLYHRELERPEDFINADSTMTITGAPLGRKKPALLTDQYGDGEAIEYGAEGTANGAHVAAEIFAMALVWVATPVSEKTAAGLVKRAAGYRISSRSDLGNMSGLVTAIAEYRARLRLEAAA